MAQSLMLAKKPHVIIATPGRLVDHLENTKGFTLKSLKCLVGVGGGRGREDRSVPKLLDLGGNDTQW